jgi:cytochrome b
MASLYATGSAARIRVWDVPLRLFHWLLVAAIALAFLSSEEDSALAQWHIVSGWVAGLLVLFRIVWGFAGGEHSRFADFVRPAAVGRHVGALLRGRAEASLGHNALGAMSVLLLLAMVAATVVTGILLVEDAHELVAWILLGLVAIHVAAVVLMSVMTRENLVRAMIGGSKPAARHAGARDATPPRLGGLILAALVLAGSVYAVHAYDPLAFTLRSAEDYEHGTGQRESGENGDRHDERGDHDR